MASITQSQGSSPHSGYSPSRQPDEREGEGSPSRATSSSPRTRRRGSLVFSEGTHPKHSTPSTTTVGPPDPGSTDHQENEEESSAGGISRKNSSTGDPSDRRKKDNGQSNPPSPDQPSSPSSATPSHHPEPKPKWYRQLASQYGSISLENTGSVARDHLALERTFLAWLRTSLAFASIGIAITQLFRLNTSLADPKQRRRVFLDPRVPNQRDGDGDGAEDILSLSPLLTGAPRLTPEIYSHIQAILQEQQQQQQRGRQVPSSPDYHSDAITLLDHLIRSTTTNTDSGSDSYSSSEAAAAARLRHIGKPLGATFLAISIVILFIGFQRYFESQHWIMRGQFPASRGSVALTGLIAAMLIVASLVVVLAIAPAALH